MKEVTTRSGKKAFLPSYEELQEFDDEGLGFCLNCGETQPAEPDARAYECDCCGVRKVYGAAELALMGLAH